MPTVPTRAAILLLALAGPCAASAEPMAPAGGDAGVAAAGLDQLQGWYLGCDRASRVAPLDRDTARGCSLVAEALLHRGFGGDFERLLAWWRVHRDRFAAAPPR